MNEEYNNWKRINTFILYFVPIGIVIFIINLIINNDMSKTEMSVYVFSILYGSYIFINCLVNRIKTIKLIKNSDKVTEILKNIDNN